MRNFIFISNLFIFLVVSNYKLDQYKQKYSKIVIKLSWQLNKIIEKTSFFQK